MQLGTREIRHIILNNQVVNSSRALHSLKHTVPKSHKNIAIHMVDHIRRLGVFPANYALDSFKSTHNRRERPVHGHRGRSRGPFYYRITTFGEGPWDARDPHKTTFMTLK